VKASLAGWKPEDVEITLTGSTLTISGETKEAEEIKPRQIKISAATGADTRPEQELGAAGSR